MIPDKGFFLATEKRRKVSAMSGDLSLADHAEMWWKEQGKEVSARGTEEWQNMYEQWIEYAFGDFRENIGK